MARYGTSSLSAATDAVAITPNDTTVLATTRGITSVAGGTATVRFADATADVQVQLNAGVVYPYAITAFRLTGSSATGVVGLY